MDRFCKYSSQLGLIRYPSLLEEYSANYFETRTKDFFNLDSNSLIYLMFRALDAFVESNQRFPGRLNELYEEDIAAFKRVVVQVAQEMGLPSVLVLPDDLIHEL
jgi:hypothetical protein